MTNKDYIIREIAPQDNKQIKKNSTTCYFRNGSSKNWNCL